MPTILAIDSSTQACSCALLIDGHLHESFEVIPRQHAARLLGMIDSLLRHCGITFADLDALAYGKGPGSFTGLRIAAGVVQGIAFAANVPVVPVSTLACQAYQLRHLAPGIVFSSLDARIDEVYWGFYKLLPDRVELIGEESLCKPEMLPAQFPTQTGPVIAAGSGLDYLERMPQIYQTGMQTDEALICPRAGAIAELANPMLLAGQVQNAEEVNPVYLRDKVTHS